MTCTNNGDGTITVEGTSTADNWSRISRASVALPAGEYVVYQRLVSGSTAPNMDITDEQQLQNLSGMSINPVRLVLDEAQTVFVRVTVAPKGTVAKATSEPVIIPASLWGGGAVSLSMLASSPVMTYLMEPLLE